MNDDDDVLDVEDFSTPVNENIPIPVTLAEEDWQIEEDLLLARGISQSLAETNATTTSANAPATITATPQTAKRWTPSEDALLIQGIGTFGFGRWTAVSRVVKTRNAMQCRNRASHLKKSQKIPAEFMQFGKRKRVENDDVDEDIDVLDLEEVESGGVKDQPVKVIVNVDNGLIASPPTTPTSLFYKPLSRNSITQAEMKSMPEWFATARNSIKSPAKYLKIRNHILDTWHRKKNEFLSKTEARKGLKEDVASFNEVFAWLHQQEFINAGIDKPAAKRVKKAHSDKAHAQEAEDPFQLVQCLTVSDLQGIYKPPFDVSIQSTCLALVDIHAHSYQTEIIGLLGGRIIFDKNADTFHATILIESLYPCNSSHSSNIQCEMDPLTELCAREYFSERGLVAVGWYHSHPTFDTSPSRRDIQTQNLWQRLFRNVAVRTATNEWSIVEDSAEQSGSSAGNVTIEPFVGIILSPYGNKAKPESSFEVVHLVSELSDETFRMQPYRPTVTVVKPETSDERMNVEFLDCMQTECVANRQDLKRPWTQDDDGVEMSRLEKLKLSVAQFDGGAEAFDTFVNCLD